jgi:CBS-domain-containing membrane protein/nucleotide-binding universal stress UspA family protein
MQGNLHFRPDAMSSNGGGEIVLQRILVGLDGSPLGRQAFQAALEFARLYRASLIALSVVEGPIPGNREHEETEGLSYYRQLQANAVEQAKAAGISLSTAIRRGHAAQALVEFAQEADVDLIMLGVTGHEHPWSLTMGGTAWRVISEARCAVIVVRPPRIARLVRDIMVRHVSTVSPQTPLAEVVELLLRRGVKGVPVVDERQHLTGIITEGDLLRRADLGFRLSVQQGLEAEAIAQQLHRMEVGGKTARDVMTSHPRTIPEAAALKTAIRMMAEHRIKHLPVIDPQGRLVGILSRADVLRVVAAGAEVVPEEEEEEVAPSPKARTVGDVMMADVPTVRPETPIDDVVHLTLSSPSRRVVVINTEGVVQGVITDRRLLARAAADIQPRFLQGLEDLIDVVAHWRSARKPLTAGDLMRTDVFTVRAEEPLIHAIQLMMQHQVKRLVVVDAEDRLQGIVDRQTLLQWLAEAAGH